MRNHIQFLEPDAAGYIQVKRKMFWVIRYAEILNGSFYYYYNKGDQKPRGVFALAGSKTIEQITSDNEYIISLTASNAQQNQRILIRCDENKDHRKWLNKLIYYSSTQKQQNQPKQENDINKSQASLINKNEANPQSERSIAESFLNMDSFNQDPNLKNNGNIFNSGMSILNKNKDLYSDQQINTQNSSHTGGANMDTLKSNPYIFDTDFLTERQGSQNTLIPLKNLLTVLESFKDCDSLTDVDKNIRIFCSKAAVDANYYNKERNQRKDKLNNNSSLDQQGLFNQIVNQYFDTIQLKVAMGLVTIIIALIIYQFSLLIGTRDLIISFLIVLNLIMLPLMARKLNDFSFQSEKKKMKQTKHGVIAEFCFPHNVNELLFALTRHFEKRKEWQLTVQKCEPKQNGNSNEYITTYCHGETEVFSQNVLKNKDIVYLTEQTHAGYLRIFAMPVNQQNEDCVNVKYYFYSPYTQIQDMSNNSNSPLILYGLNLYLKQLKRNPFSPLFDYYYKTHKNQSNNPSLLKSENSSINNQQTKVNSQSTINNNQLSSKHNNNNSNNQQNENNGIQLKVENQTSNSKNIDISQNGLENKQDEKDQTKNKSSLIKKVEEQEEEESKVEISKDDGIKLLEGENGQKYNDKIKELVELIKSQSNLSPSNKWKEGENKPDYKTHTKIDEETGNVMSRGEVNIKKSAQDIVAYIQDASKRKSWDDMFKSGKEIEMLSENCRIEHNVFNGVFPVSDRDFCLLQITLKIQNTHFLLATSVTHPQVPEVKKPVRGTLKIGGWIIDPISEKESNCIYLTCSDLNGSIPQSIKDIAAKKQSMNSVKLKKAIEGK